VFVVRVPWLEAGLHTLVPDLALRADYLLTLVAVFGTTISPYLFFWQASQEVERAARGRRRRAAARAPEQAKAQLHRIKIDTYIGMTFSNLVAFFIMLTTAVTCTRTASPTSRPRRRRPRRSADRRRVRVPAVRGGHRRHRHARRAGARRVRCVRRRRILPLADRPGPEADGSARFLRHPHRRDDDRRRAQLHEIDPVKALIWSAVINGVISVGPSWR